MDFSIMMIQALGKQLEGQWEALDRSNFSAFYIVDHSAMGLPDPWTFLGYVAARTQRIHLGTHVTAVAFHHPTRLATQVATVDVLSGGRARLGIGVGYNPSDFEPYGFVYRPIKERLDLLEETLRVMNALWTQENATYEGRLFQLRGGVNFEPKPFQKPHPPIIVGVNTKGRALRIAAALADGINSWQMGPHQVAEIRDFVGEQCRAIGRDPATLALTSDVILLRGGTEEAARQLAQQISSGTRGHGRAVEATQWGAGGILYGDEDSMVEQAQKFEAIGVSELTVSIRTLEDLRWFSERVIPKFR